MRIPNSRVWVSPEARGSLVVSWAPREIRRPPYNVGSVSTEIAALGRGFLKYSLGPVVCPSLAQNSFPVPQKSASISSPYLLSAHTHTLTLHPPGSSPATRLPEPLTGFQLPLPLGLTACLWPASFPAHLGQYVFVFTFICSVQILPSCEGQRPSAGPSPVPP